MLICLLQLLELIQEELITLFPAKFTFAGYFAKVTGAGAGSATVKVIDSAIWL